MDKFRIEVTRFTIVGAANFLLTFVVFTTMLKFFKINYLLSLIAAWLVGVVFSYFFNFTWVFLPEQKIQFRKRFAKYFLAGLFSIIVNTIALRYIVEINNYDPFYVQIFLIPLIIVINFSTAKFWSLRPNECS